MLQYFNLELTVRELINDFLPAILIYCTCYILVLMAIVSDLISGVRKAKKAGIMRTSEGYKRTIDKIARYYNMLFAISIIDIFLMMAVYVFQIKGMFGIVPTIPFCTVLAGCYIAFVEARSVMETLETKEKKMLGKDMEMFMTVLKDKDKMDKLLKLVDAMNKPAHKKHKKESDDFIKIDYE